MYSRGQVIRRDLHAYCILKPLIQAFLGEVLVFKGVVSRFLYFIGKPSTNKTAYCTLVEKGKNLIKYDTHINNIAQIMKPTPGHPLSNEILELSILAHLQGEGAQGHWPTIAAVGFSLSLRFETLQTYQGGLLSHIEAILRPYCADIEDATCRYDAIANQGWYHKNGLGGFNMVQHDSNWSHKSQVKLGGTGAVCGTGAVWVVLTPVPCGHRSRGLGFEFFNTFLCYVCCCFFGSCQGSGRRFGRYRSNQGWFDMLSLSVCQSFYGNPLARPLLKKPGTLVNIKTAAWMFIPKNGTEGFDPSLY